jgi:hypothetical protein
MSSGLEITLSFNSAMKFSLTTSNPSAARDRDEIAKTGNEILNLEFVFCGRNKF